MIEKVKTIENAASKAPWYIPEVGVVCSDSDSGSVILGYLDDDCQPCKNYEANLKFLFVLRNLAPELIGLWEAVQKYSDDKGDQAKLDIALSTLNTKAAYIFEHNEKQETK